MLHVETGKVWAGTGWRLLLMLAMVVLGPQSGWGAAPTIVGFGPSGGAPGTPVIITGGPFDRVGEVRFNQAPAVFSVASSTHLVATVPVLGESGLITVVSADGVGISREPFYVAPVVTDVVPDRGVAGTVVTLFGRNLDTLTNVVLGGVSASFSAVAPGQLAVVVPSGAGSGVFRLSGPGGTGLSPRAFSVGSNPALSGFEPSLGRVGTPVVIQGVNLAGVTSVVIGGRAAAFDIVAPTQINAVVPALAQTGVVILGAASGRATSSVPFVVIENAPIITGISPLIGAVGTQVVVDGHNLDTVTSVRVGGVASSFAATAPTQLIVPIGAGALSGYVVASNRFGVATSSVPFTVLGKGPLVTSFSPSRVKPGGVIILSGENLLNTTGVRIGGTNALFSVTAPTQLAAQVPSGAVTGPIVVSNLFGSFTTSSNLVVSREAPVIDGFTPTSGSPGTEVLVQGFNLEDVTEVWFGLAKASFVITAPTQLRTVVPTNAVTSTITVVSPTGRASSLEPFYLPPRLVSHTPVTGGAGDLVLISGGNLGDTVGVRFGGVAAEFLVLNPGLVRVTVPWEAVSGPINVETPGGIVSFTNRFLVRPVVRGFTPEFGPPGTVVTLDGGGFEGVGQVTINGVGWPFQVVTNTQLRASVPLGAGVGPIRVRTAVGEGVSTNIFISASAADVELTSTNSVRVVEPGSVWSQSLVVWNLGPSYAVGTMVTNDVASGVEIVGVTTTHGSASFVSNRVVGVLGVVTNGTFARVEMRMRAARAGTYLSEWSGGNQVQDINPLNNRGSSRQLVLSGEELRLRLERMEGGSLALSYPTSVVVRLVERRVGLTSPVRWERLGLAPVLEVDRWFLRVGATNSAEYFRLVVP